MNEREKRLKFRLWLVEQGYTRKWATIANRKNFYTEIWSNGTDIVELKWGAALPEVCSHKDGFTQQNIEEKWECPICAKVETIYDYPDDHPRRLELCKEQNKHSYCSRGDNGEWFCPSCGHTDPDSDARRDDED